MYTYLVTNDLEHAKLIIAQIDKRIKITDNQTFDNPRKHPIDEFCLVVVPEYPDINFNDIIDGLEQISLDEAKRRGWYFGHFKGIFAREREKLEDMYLLIDALEQNYGKPNFPVIRAITLSYLGASYSLKESLKVKLNKPRFANVLKSWWKDKLKEQEETNSVLKKYQIFMNTEKHGGSLASQHSELDISPFVFFNSLIVEKNEVQPNWTKLELSAEGAFMTSGINTAHERRHPVGIHGAEYIVNVQNPPTLHLGKDISQTNFMEHMEMILDYYRNLLFELDNKRM